mmetsp:Transcript_16359/g.44437  ORF Transcript_16359/g.44437 Transcript_16359/m.44437 type:complete len:139 (+) Transcript_16359:690-1106(+)
MLPTDEEMKSLRVYRTKNKGDLSRLAPAEQFVLMLGEMPLIHDWLSALIFRAEFPARRDEMQAKLSIAMEAARKAQDCEALRDMLALGLALGNFINEGHMLGNAQVWRSRRMTMKMDVEAWASLRGFFVWTARWTCRQ